MSDHRDHHPVGNFFIGLFLGTLTSFSGIFVTLMGIGSFLIAAGIVVAIPLLIGISLLVSKRKFLAIGFFMSLPIVFFIFYSICGTFLYDI
ncbi:hypothetical protein ACFWM3_06945 [Gottfriedia sp. NPDC058432]|uniref:hypothetical protein n=1 Tax=Gottfriedia sp. NPDC058432 TaxID=3346497 RepID=UPI00365DCE02